MKPQILFVDDDQQILDSINVLLRKQRSVWDFHYANTALSALKIMEENKIDIIVSDIQMPEKNGIWLLTQVQERYPQTIRILLSGYAESLLTIQATAITQQYLSKPVEPAKLIDVLERNCLLLSCLQNDLFREIAGKIRYLPSASEIYARLVSMLDSPMTSSDQLAKVIEKDIGLTAKVLQIANSSFFSMAKKTTQVKNAIIYIGSSILKSIVINEEIGKMLLNNKLPVNFSVASLNRHSFNISRIMKVVVLDDAMRESAFIAGLLHEIGQLVLASQMPEEMYSMIEESKKRQVHLHEIEYERHEVSHAEIGAYLLSLWGVSATVVEAIANHHRIERYEDETFTIADALNIADHLSCVTMGTCTRSEEQIALQSERFARLGVLSKIAAWKDEVQKLQVNGEIE